MDKDLIKGLAMVLGVLLALATVFVMASNSGPQKAECIARALKAGVAYANIDSTCHLTQRSY